MFSTGHFYNITAKEEAFSAPSGNGSFYTTVLNEINSKNHEVYNNNNK
jgi:hypothetical protein